MIMVLKRKLKKIVNSILIFPESASFDEIKSVEGVEEKVAKKIYNFFHE